MRRRNNPLYFPHIPDAPHPITAQVKRKVRFEEVDPLGIVWHGRYPSYIEDGRAAFGEKYGIGYLDMYRENFMAPVVQMHIDYHSPLSFPEEFTITASLHWAESVRLNFQYLITGHDGRVVSTGYTVQLLMNLKREVLLARPEFVEDFCRRWKEKLFNE
ncbi:MAG TPA: acyl-CoA thioesterase [Nitrospiraceae bacterium]|nr:MAG: thioesterase [Nitrospirae bacterium RIFCSPHIGHO2_02_FULL_42_12]HAS16742.1 acyl-CoA thioesterase [Nitrospiraceae bacterium]HBI24061.1 acyl-CoA thioesterase [Nitrospiraceae bacterium]